MGNAIRNADIMKLAMKYEEEKTEKTDKRETWKEGTDMQSNVDENYHQEEGDQESWGGGEIQKSLKSERNTQFQWC